MQNLTKELIAIESVTGGEAKIVDFICDVLTERGMKVRTFAVAGGRKNVLATWEEASPGILFNTHLDTVPPQYGPHEDEERIYGRGACDTHGIFAAQLEAVCDLHNDGVKGIGILLVVGEETTHDGAIHAAKCPEIVEPEVLIVGEPTENKLMKSQKGRLKADLCVYGEEGHSGYPEKFDSAVEKLFLFLDVLWQAPWLKKHSDDGTTLNVTILAGGDADNKIPGFARARLVFRCAGPCSVIKKRTVQILNGVGASLAKEAAPHFQLKWDPVENDSITNLCTLPDFEVAAAAYNTDIAYFGWKSCKTFLLGPGSILQAHRDLKNENWLGGEWILKQEQIKGVELYKKLIHSVVQ